MSVGASAGKRLLTREWIRSALYLQGEGYFSVQDCVYSPPAPVRFKELSGKAAYLSKLDALYAARSEAFLTPVEIFRPWFSRAIGRYLMKVIDSQGLNDGRPLRIFEAGGGNGTNALHILDHIKETSPSLYERTQYTLVEVSAAMAERQERRVCEAHPGHSAVINQDFSEWSGGRVEEDCFVLALEVLDNLSHDKLVRKVENATALVSAAEPWWHFREEDKAQWFQTVVTEAGNGALTEELEPLSDPLALRAARAFLQPVRHPQQADAAASVADLSTSSLSSFSEKRARWARKSELESRRKFEAPSKGATEAAVFVPSCSMRLLETLRDSFPKHRLIAADFDFLPTPELGVFGWLRGRPSTPGSLFGCRNAPLVASKDASGRTVDHTSYLEPQIGTADIYFRTDFEQLAQVYAETIGKSSRAVRQGNFMAEHAEHGYTRTRSGYNPLLEDYYNTQFLLSP